ncbi:MAG: YitT family protein [Desulfobulbaceae bacterium]|nr:YitT family protein [Desulfobulbaceae bacterium]
MPNHTTHALFTSWQRLLLDLLLLTIGGVIFAVGVNSILAPRHFAIGGVAGLSLIINNLFPALNLGLLYLLINLPLFVTAWMVVGRRFFFYSLIGTSLLSLAMALVHWQITLDDRLLAAILAGVLCGAGAGISLRSAGSQGGLDILSVVLLKRFSINIGSTVLAVNIAVLLLVALFYTLEAVLYTLVALYVSARVIALVVTGLSQRKAVIIISPRWREISGEILQENRRGATILKGRGAGNGKDKQIIYSVVSIAELGAIKRLVLRHDPNAFMVVSDTQEVIDHRIGNQPPW